MPLIIAHRGASGYLPEHTRPAKVLAYFMGADYLEQDVVATRDDELLVIHDIHLDRVTDVASRFRKRARSDGRFYVRDFTLAEIRTLNVRERVNSDGSPVYADRYPPGVGHFELQTLGEEIDLISRLNAASGRQVGLYPEIKRPAWHREEGVDVAALLLDSLHEHGYSHSEDPVFVQCFDDAELRRLREEYRYPWKLIQLIGENAWNEAATDYEAVRTPEGLEAVAATADGIGPWLPQLYSFVDKSDDVMPTNLTRTAHDLGLLVHPYTFRRDDLPPGFTSFDELLRFFTAEVAIDGLFTDFPDLARDSLRELYA